MLNSRIKIKSKKNLSNPAQAYQDSTDLIKKLRLIKVGNTSLGDYLRFEGISLWDIVAPHQAMYILPDLFFGQQNKGRFQQLYQWRVKPYLRWFRDNLREFQEKRSFKEITSVGKKNSTKIMFLNFEPRQIEVFAPIIDLLKDNSTDITVIGSRYRLAKNRLPESNAEYMEIEDFFNYKIIKKVEEGRKLLKEKWSGLKRDQQFKNELKYKGISLWPYLKYNFLNLFIHSFPQLIKQIEIAEFILDVVKPDIIIGADDWDERARIYFLIGKKRKIPTLHIQYGLTGAKITWKFMSTDKAAVFDERAYQSLIKKGLNSKNLVITGNPRFDCLARKENTKKKICQRFKIDPISRLVLFTSQPNVMECFPSEKIRRKLIATIYNAVTKLSGTQLIVKPHPDENVSFHSHLKSKIKSAVVTEKNFNTQELILACDALITFHSTTALEVLIADKPIILFKIPERTNPAQYFEKNCVLEVESENELISAIKDILSDSPISRSLSTARKEFINKQKYLDGRASERIYELIYSMVKDKAKKEKIS